MPELWTDLLDCLQLRTADEAGRFEGRNHRLEYHRVFGGQLLGQLIEAARAVCPDKALGAAGWHISVDGDAPLEVDLRMPVPLERMAEISPGYTAHRAVNAVPFLCAAEPGIRTTLDLPQILTGLR